MGAFAIEARHYSNRVNSYIDSLNRELDRTETLPIDLRRALFDTLIIYKQGLCSLFDPAVTGIDTQNLYEPPYQLWTHHCVLEGFLISVANDTAFHKWDDTMFSNDLL